jgi:signal transduction histidine kinase
MAVVLLATSGFLYWRLSTGLDRAIEEELVARFDTLAAGLRQAGVLGSREGRPHVEEGQELVVQVLSARGAVVVERSDLTSPLITSPRVIQRALLEQTTVAQAPVPGSDEPFRLLAGPVESPRGEAIGIVGRSLEDRGETLEALLTQLALGGPSILLLSSLLAYLVAAAALRPVESMRRQAEAIGARDQTKRLRVPQTADEISRLGITLNEMLARLETSYERERAFVTDASHELRTPLAMLRMEVEVALRRARTTAELESALRVVGTEAERLSGLAEDLLVLARADEGELVLDLESISVTDLLHTTAARVAPLAKELCRPVAVQECKGLEVHADKGMLERALVDLVENALIHGGGEVVLLAQDDSPSPGLLGIHVLDAGSGFAEDFLPRAFERFSRADRARAGNGAGLGLALAQAVAVSLGGWAAARNREAGGADVYLVLRKAAAGRR